MKKFLLLLICSTPPLLSSAAGKAVEVGGLWYEAKGAYAEVVASPEKDFIYAADLLIPGSVLINGATIPVNYIASNAFEGVSEIKTLNFDSELNSITIGKEAFKDSGLEKVVIDAGVYSIGESAFEGSALKSVLFKKRFLSNYDERFESLTISDRAFANTKNLKNLESEQNFQYLNFNSRGSDDPEVYFPNTSSEVFAGSGLENITLYPGFGAPGMFKGCTDLKELKFAEDKSGEKYAVYNEQFYGTAIRSITFPKESLTFIGELAFADMTELQSATVYDNYIAVLDHPDVDVKENLGMQLYEQMGCFRNSGSEATLYLSPSLYDRDAQNRLSLYGFKNVEMIGGSETEWVAADKISVVSEPGAVVVRCAAGSLVMAAGIDGQAITRRAESSNCRFELDPGIYIISVNGQAAAKVMVR